MESPLAEFVEDLKKKLKSDESNILGYDEAATKQGLIIPVLHHLGWDTFDVNEVFPEYNMDGKRVDYSLRIKGENRLFIEAKKTSENLDNHQEQLLNYAFKEGAEIALLTNGITWWFYLPLKKGNWEQRKFFTIHIPQQEDEDITANFEKFLKKEQVENGKALKSAEDVHRSQRRLNILNETIPQAWNALILKPDELLIELVAEGTEEICGFKPNEELIESFINKYRRNFVVGDVTTPVAKPKKVRKGQKKTAKRTGIGKKDGKELIEVINSDLRIQLEQERGVCFKSSDGKVHVVILVSKFYEKPKCYWFGLRQNQKEFLNQKRNSYLALGCGQDHVFLFKWSEFKPFVKNFNITDKGDPKKSYEHINIFDRDDKLVMGQPEVSNGIGLSKFLIR